MDRESASSHGPPAGSVSLIAAVLISLLMVTSCSAKPPSGLAPTFSSAIGKPNSSTQQTQQPQQPHQADTTSSGPASKPAAKSTPADTLPADSPLTDCIDPAPPTPKPIDTALAQDFAGHRIREPLVLDNGTFRALPAPPNVQPRVSAALALCNLLAAATAHYFSVISAAAEHGLSFGLAVVTVADSVPKTGPLNYLANGQRQNSTLQPYHARLAWIAVIKPDVETSCPTPTPHAPTRPPHLPDYQILAIDADTGAAGITYSAKTNALCGLPGYQAPDIAPAVEFVSVPWTLLSRGPGSTSATISYQPRPCDRRDFATFAGTGRPVVHPDHTDPELVSVVLARTLTTCGPATPTPILLRSATLATDLPERLTHAPIGARNAPGP